MDQDEAVSSASTPTLVAATATASPARNTSPPPPSPSPLPSPSLSQVNEFWQQKYRREAAKNWNQFYRRNETRFFKDRHWISREFPELLAPETSRVLEVGCGVGNFALPLAEENALLAVFACDFAERAIELFRADERYAHGRCTAFVADLTAGDLAKTVPAGSIDVVTCIFVFSALPPEKFADAVRNIRSVLRPGGLVLFRDYCAQDAAQVRFKADRRLGESLYVRQDGTLSYFFSTDELAALFVGEGFAVESCDVVHSKTTNVKKEIDVDRLFVQAKFRRA